MNSLLKLMQGGNQNKGLKLMMQAFAAMKRGESPETFMANLAKTEPELQGLDFSDLAGTSHQLAQQKGVDEQELATKLQQQFTN